MIFIVLILSLFFSIVQAFLNLDLVLILSLTLSLFGQKRQVFLNAFLSGLFLDLALFQRLGASSMLFLAFSFFICFYRERFDPLHLLFLPLFLFFSSLIYSGVFLGEIEVKRALFSLLLGVVVRFLLLYFDSGFKKKSIKLNL